MEVPTVNESSFTPSNPASYSLDGFWPQSHHAIINHARVTGMPLPIDTLDDESTLTHQSLSRSTMRTVPRNPTASAVQQMHNSSSKRVKVLELKEEKMILNEEMDNTSVTSAKQNKKVTEPSKQDYIHVRARRGQATDSHSLAERARREKISERMKVLQDLVPGCNKVVGIALMLDEIIKYVLSLQHQVEFLSMKLEAINSSVLPKDKMLPAKIHNSSSKRVKVLELKEEKMILNEEVDNTSVMSVKQNKKVTEPSKQDYIHVRARRGQATDSHSLAERARRGKISERMKVLQDLVPGCNKVVGKAHVLDEIINYFLSLQHQVEFLSVKLEAINSSVLPKEKILPAKNLEVPTARARL